MLSVGARPLTESFVILIYAFLKEKNVKTAKAVFSSMLRPDADVDAQKGVPFTLLFPVVTFGCV